MLATASWRSLGTSAHLVTYDLDLATARTAVERVLDDVDATYSRFRADSELRRLQAHAGREIRVSPLLGQAIEAALRAARETDGAVDPTIGRQMRAIGYDDDFTRVASRGVPLTIERRSSCVLRMTGGAATTAARAVRIRTMRSKAF
jgi:thiamine biosynthesis lipoprotein